MAISITPEAAEQLLGIMQEAGLETAFLRVAITGYAQGLEYALGFEDVQGDEDQVMETHGLRVLLDPATNSVSATLDYADDPRPGFRLIADQTGCCGGGGCGGGCHQC